MTTARRDSGHQYLELTHIPTPFPPPPCASRISRVSQEFDPHRAQQLYGSPAAVAGGPGGKASDDREHHLKASLGLDDDQDFVDDEVYSEEGEEQQGYVPSAVVNGASVNKDATNRISALAAANEKLEQEVEALRASATEAEARAHQVEARGAEAMAVRANALKHLQAAEDHVGLLLNESRNKLEVMARENEGGTATRGSAAPHVGAGTTHAGGFGGGLADVERQELDLLRGEVKEYMQTQAEMDAEAEEREGELKVAYEHIKQLQEALRQSQSVTA